jgi:hypothetical protein
MDADWVIARDMKGLAMRRDWIRHVGISSRSSRPSAIVNCKRQTQRERLGLPAARTMAQAVGNYLGWRRPGKHVRLGIR